MRTLVCGNRCTELAPPKHPHPRPRPADAHANARARAQMHAQAQGRMHAHARTHVWTRARTRTAAWTHTRRHTVPLKTSPSPRSSTRTVPSESLHTTCRRASIRVHQSHQTSEYLDYFDTRGLNPVPVQDTAPTRLSPGSRSQARVPGSRPPRMRPGQPIASMRPRLGLPRAF